VPSLLTDRVIKKIYELKPSCANELRPFFPLHKIGAGVFRNVYRIGRSIVVIKFPRNKCSVGLTHSRREINFLQRARKSPDWCILKYYVPALLYADPNKGTVAMTYHKTRTKYYSFERETMLEHIFRLAGTRIKDIHKLNIGRNSSDRTPRLIDFGY
jgi:hypothetical protein